MFLSAYFLEAYIKDVWQNFSSSFKKTSRFLNNNNNRSLNSITHRKLSLYMKILGQHFLNVFHSFVKYSSWAKIFMNCCIVYSPLEETIKNSLCVWYTIILEIHTDTGHIVTLKYYMKEQKVYVRIKGIKS